MKIEIMKGPRPKLKPRPGPRKRWADTYDAMASLKPGQWFIVPGSRDFDEPTRKRCLCALRKRAAAISRADIAVGESDFATSKGAVVVLCADEVE